MSLLALGPFRPNEDVADTNPGVLADLLNASLLPDSAGVAYGPLPGLVVAATATALPAAPKGTLTCVNDAGVYLNFVMTSTNIYLLAADGTSTSIGSGYNLPSGDKWGRCPFGDATSNYAIFSNTADGMLKYDIESGGAVTAVSGAPAARIVQPVFDSLFALHCDGENRLMRNADINSLRFTGGTSGYQPMPDGEGLMGIAEVTDGTALVFQRNAIRVLYRADSAIMFNMRKPISNKGAVNPWCIVPVNGAAYIIDTNGPQRVTAGGIEPIGRGKVANWFLARLAANGLASIEGAYDAEREVIRWRYMIGTDAADTVFASALDFDIATEEFVPVEESTSAIFTTATPGYTMEELDAFGDMDDLNGDLSLDDSFYFGGVPQLGALDENFKLGYFSGASLAATFETSTFAENNSSQITSLKPVTDSTGITIQIGRSDDLGVALTWNAAASKRASGRVRPAKPTRGKNHRMRAIIPAADAWTYFRGADDVETRPGGPK